MLTCGGKMEVNREPPLGANVLVHGVVKTTLETRKEDERGDVWK